MGTASTVEIKKPPAAANAATHIRGLRIAQLRGFDDRGVTFATHFSPFGDKRVG
jgi:hypothetical protein